eukprot:3878399-Alexandrium_andersonii.AAC.1
MDKTKELAINSDQRVHFVSGRPVPRVDHIKYLGTIIEGKSGLSREVGNRIGQASRAFKALSIVWKDKALSKANKLTIYNACIKSRLTYGLGVTWPHPTLLKRLSACHARFVRRIWGTPSTYGALQMGIKPVSNVEVLKRAG